MLCFEKKRPYYSEETTVKNMYESKATAAKYKKENTPESNEGVCYNNGWRLQHSVFSNRSTGHR